MSFQNCTIRGRDCDATKYHEAANATPRGDKGHIVTSGMLREGGHCWARWLAGYQPPDSDAKDFGSLFDLLATSPKLFGQKYAVRPETYKATEKGVAGAGEDKEWNNNATVCKEWNKQREAEGRKPIKKAEFTEVETAVKRLHQDPVLKSFVDQSQMQTWLQGEWKDDATGLIVPVQCLVDLAPKVNSEFAQCLGDVKTTRSAAPHVWSKYSSQRAYHIQAGFYLDIWNQATGEERDTWCFILSENFPPYQTGKVILSQQKLEYGRILYQAYLAQYCKCLATGEWPDYQRGKDYKGPDVIDGWSVDMATKWDELDAARAMEGAAPTEDVPEEDPEFTSMTPS